MRSPFGFRCLTVPHIAFTLIELLLVIAIIGLLAGLLLPVLARGKIMAKGIGCLSNLKQWGFATHLFAANHDDYLPRDGSPNGTSTQEGWYVDLPRVMGLKPYPEAPWRTNALVDPGRSVWICPANPRRSNGHNLFHYCLNQQVNGTGNDNQPVTLSSLPLPSTQVWLFDNGKLAAVARQNNVHTNLHLEGAQFLFLDGHGARFGNRAYWDFERGCGRTNHPALRWLP